MTHFEKVLAWEAAWSELISKLKRLDELKALGRYGYQLRQPKKAVLLAEEKCRAFEKLLDK